MQAHELEQEKAKWSRILANNIHGPNHRTGAERLSAYLCSLLMGRDFLEDSDAYIQRKGLSEFFAWAQEQLKKERSNAVAS